SAQIREILISESAWEEMTCLFAPSLIVLHSAFSGLIKNWLLDPQRFDLYQQAPALVDNVMAVVCAAHVSEAPVLRAVNQ
ncbi:hypothetical protein PAG33_18915, partial [Klebsiella quasipneumoniae]|nr:hypothetical protein [Klebsiella quasipneumoniae]